jgi:hypothetical protein
MVAAVDRTAIDANLADVAVKLLWQLRRSIVAQMESAPAEKISGLRAALKGIDGLLRANFDNRVNGRWDVRRN